MTTYHKKGKGKHPLCGEDQLGFVFDNPQKVTCRACQILMLKPELAQSTLIEDLVKISKSLNKKESEPNLAEAAVFLKDNYGVDKMPVIDEVISMRGKSLTVSDVSAGISGGEPTLYVTFEEEQDASYNWYFIFKKLDKE